MPTLLICLLAIPLASAVAIALLGLAAGRPDAEDGPGRFDCVVRWISLGSTVASLVVAVVVAGAYANTPDLHTRQPDSFEPKTSEGKATAEVKTFTFRPSMVPGGASDKTETSHSTTWNVLTFGDWYRGAPAIQFFVGIDGLNVWLVLLTAVLLVPSVLVSWKAIQTRVPEFYAWMLVLQMSMVGVFLAFDLVLFYVFFELTLVPLFFLIGIWGGPERQYAAHKFFVYTLAGSMLTLLGVLAIALVLAQEGPDQKFTFSIPELVTQGQRHGAQLDWALTDARHEAIGKAEASLEVTRLRQAEQAANHWQRVQFWVFLAMMCGFAIKVPLVPFHTWLPLAHTEAPTAGSVLLAGVLLKLGAYGFLRLCLPLVPDASLTFEAPLLGALAVVGVLYGSFCALGQHDMKKLVAYSSVAHMGFCVLGLFALNEVGISGGMMQMINHGLSTGALFLLVGMLYERYHTRKMSDYGGMAKRLRLLAFFFVFITMSSIGLPGLNGFVGETLSLLGMYGFEGSQVNGRLLASLATVGVLLGAWYMLTLVMRVFFGELREPGVSGEVAPARGHAESHAIAPATAHHGVTAAADHAAGHGLVGDLSPRELTALVPIALLCLALGVYPGPFLDTVRSDVRVVANVASGARKRVALLAGQPTPAPEADAAAPAEAGVGEGGARLPGE